MRVFQVEVGNSTTVKDSWPLRKSDRHFYNLAGWRFVLPREELMRSGNGMGPHIRTGLDVETDSNGIRLIEDAEDQQTDRILVAIFSYGSADRTTELDHTLGEQVFLKGTEENHGSYSLLTMRAGDSLTIKRTTMVPGPSRKIADPKGRTWYLRRRPEIRVDGELVEQLTADILHFNGHDLVVFKDGDELPVDGWVQVSDDEDPAVAEARENDRLCDDQLKQNWIALKRQAADSSAMTFLNELVGLLERVENGSYSETNRDDLIEFLERAEPASKQTEWRRKQKDALALAKTQMSELWEFIGKAEQFGVSADELSSAKSNVVSAIIAKIRNALLDTGFPATTLDERLEQASEEAAQSEDQWALPESAGGDPTIADIEQSIASAREPVPVPR